MKEQIISALQKINPSFSSEEIEEGLQYFEVRTFNAKEIISEEGKVSNYLFFAESSITRCFYEDSEGKEKTLWMKPEQTFIAEYKSFTTREKSTFNLQFYEKTNAYLISRENLLHLFKTSNNWALFGIYLTEQLHVTLIDVFVNLLANDATRNYQYIQYAFPRFLQVAPLKDIASMLNVSQVTLSRIRSGNQLK
ncbi:MAG: Crp/Fnr family transcriptional regulator [Saprospiraceae bacterium]